MAGVIQQESYVCPRCGLTSDEPFTWAHKPLNSNIRTCGGKPVRASEVEAAREREKRTFLTGVLKVARAESDLRG